MTMLMREREKLEEGIAQGMTQGIAQGITQGIAQGIAQGITQGIAKGMTKGVQKGIHGTVSILRGIGMPDEFILSKIVEQYDLTADEAKDYLK